MRKKELYDKVIAYFKEAMPVAETELDYDSPFSLLVAVILSAQCTDKRVNLVTPSLMHDYPTAEAMALAASLPIGPKVNTAISFPSFSFRPLPTCTSSNGHSQSTSTPLPLG